MRKRISKLGFSGNKFNIKNKIIKNYSSFKFVCFILAIPFKLSYNLFIGLFFNKIFLPFFKSAFNRFKYFHFKQNSKIIQKIILKCTVMLAFFCRDRPVTIPSAFYQTLYPLRPSCVQKRPGSLSAL